MRNTGFRPLAFRLAHAPYPQNPSMIPPRVFSLLAFAASLGCGTIVSAQSDAGLIGKRYFQVTYLNEEARDLNVDNANGFGGGVNLPVQQHWDVGVDASYLRYSDFDFTEKRLNSVLRGHVTGTESSRFFIDLMLSYDAQASVVGGVHYKNNELLWGAGLGMELAATSSTAFVVSVARTEWFDTDLDGYTTYTLGVNHWFTPKLNVSAAVVWLQSETVTYRVSCNVRF